jgi:hypothetical protein
MYTKCIYNTNITPDNVFTLFLYCNALGSGNAHCYEAFRLNHRSVALNIPFTRAVLKVRYAEGGCDLCQIVVVGVT